MNFLLQFALISYAAMMFFTIGFGFAVNKTNHMSLIKLSIIFVIIAIFLSLPFNHESLQNRIIISLIWTSILGNGFRFGRKIVKHESNHNL